MAPKLKNLPKVAAITDMSKRTRASDTIEGASGIWVKEKIVGDFSSKFTYGLVPTDRLLIDPSYQREPNLKWISYLAHHWNENKHNPFVVSLRKNDNYYVIDGQQSHSALQLMDNPPTQVFAKIFTGLTVVEEADLFTSAAEDRKGLTTTARFKSALRAKHTWAVAINHAAEAAGMTVGRSGQVSANITAIDAARKVYTRRNEWFLTRVLGIANSAWPDIPNAARSIVIYGLEHFILKFDGKFDLEHLVKALSGTTPKRLEATAHGYAETLESSINPATGYAIYAVYNKGLRKNKLTWDWE